ncbi:hypothetical protein HDU97_007896 [Phlyctochytrium planicorne]|nr:hypothetical protein HDU97_007896 [Phlyctochytrium planicorne]
MVPGAGTSELVHQPSRQGTESFHGKAAAIWISSAAKPAARVAASDATYAQLECSSVGAEEYGPGRCDEKRR